MGRICARLVSEHSCGTDYTGPLVRRFHALRADYFAAMEIPLLQGRLFSKQVPP